MKVVVVIGTRPEAIKMSPVVLCLKAEKQIDVKVCLTGQHKTMVDAILKFFKIDVDIDFNLMTHNQTLAEVTGKIVMAFDEYLKVEKPDLVLIQGDTTTAFASALAAFYNNVKIGHIEAGLRTWNKFSPFPEEFNRTAISKIADIHFAPTKWSQKNLFEDKVAIENIHITGNTVIDALLIAIKNLKAHDVAINGLSSEIFEADNKVILITGHRRENFGAGFKQICEAIAILALRYSEVQFVYPVHMNPNVRNVVNKLLSGLVNVHLIEPLDYPAFIRLMQRSYLILTDSGGVQEEAPSLGKPVLVMRDTTERPEAVEAGTVKLVGTNTETIVNACSLLLDNPELYKSMASINNPYGDGKSSERIVKIIKTSFA